MNIDDQNEKNDFLKSDGTGTENKTSSENEHQVTYVGTDSMHDDPKNGKIFFRSDLIQFQSFFSKKPFIFIQNKKFRNRFFLIQ